MHGDPQAATRGPAGPSLPAREAGRGGQVRPGGASARPIGAARGGAGRGGDARNRRGSCARAGPASWAASRLAAAAAVRTGRTLRALGALPAVGCGGKEAAAPGECGDRREAAPEKAPRVPGGPWRRRPKTRRSGAARAPSSPAMALPGPR